MLFGLVPSVVVIGKSTYCVVSVVLSVRTVSHTPFVASRATTSSIAFTSLCFPD